MTCELLTEDAFVKLVHWYIVHYKEACNAHQTTPVVKKLEIAIMNECANEESREKVIFRSCTILLAFTHLLFCYLSSPPTCLIMSTKCDRDSLEYYNLDSNLTL